MPKSLDQAIAQMEGFNVAGSLAQRNNNPGNLRAGPGMTGTDANGLAIFPDQATGWSALDAWIQSHSSMTLSAAVDKYLGIQRDAQGNIVGNVDKNNPTSYLNGLVSMTGMQPDQTLSGAAIAPPVDASSDTSADSTPGFLDLTGIDPNTLLVVGVVAAALGVAMVFKS